MHAPLADVLVCGVEIPVGDSGLRFIHIFSYSSGPPLRGIGVSYVNIKKVVLDSYDTDNDNPVCSGVYVHCAGA